MGAPHWANGGETKLSNLVSLCRFHHHAVHEGGVQVVVLDDGAFRFVKPNGEALDSVAEGFTQPLSDWSEVVEINADEGVHIDSKTAVTRWCGEKMDYGLGIEVLLQKHRKAKCVAAETSEHPLDLGCLLSARSARRPAHCNSQPNPNSCRPNQPRQLVGIHLLEKEEFST